MILPRARIDKSRRARLEWGEAEAALKIGGATSLYLNPLLLIVWFFIWGLCPWSAPASIVQAPGPAHAEHAGRKSDTHHAAKGTEHSCSGAISYSKSDLGSDRLLNATGLIETTVLIANHPGSNRPPYFFESTFLPKLLTAYYQLYSVYRI